MRTRFASSRVLTILALSLTAVFLMSANGYANGKGDKGLSDEAFDELSDAGVDKYLGAFEPISSVDVGDGWTKHTFDPAFGLQGPNGPVCIAGTPFSAFTREGDPKKLLVMHQGGGACWQDFYNCNVLSEDQEPPSPPVGIWDFDNKDNVLGKYSILYMPYCDGSTFGGDNAVFDPAFGTAIGVPEAVFRFHYGLRNASAGMDLAAATFPDAEKVVVAGSSAGGVGAAAFAPFLARFNYGNNVNLAVFNDAGPIAVNLDPNNAAAQADMAARAADWQFGKFYPASCTDCSVTGQQTAIIKWRLDNDSAIREAFYETEFDQTNRFFTRLLFDPFGYRTLIVTEHGMLNAAHPDRYKRFIVNSSDTSHTALQSPLFYLQTADGVFVNDWTSDFLKNRPGWVDIVEDHVP
jgi:hypothetical protein